MNNKKILLICLLLTSLLVLAASCGSGKKSPKTDYFIGGKEGLVASFVQGEPATDVFEKEDFAISLNLENKGEYDIKPNEIIATLVGVSYADFQIKQQNLRNQAPVNGLQRSPEGSTLPTTPSTELRYTANYRKDTPVNIPFDLGVNVCYNYQTNAKTKLCLKKDLRGAEDPNCKINEQKLVGNSGAPVQVSSLFEARAGQNEVSLTMMFTNVGRGDVYSRSLLSKESCVEDRELKNLLNVKVEFSEEDIAVRCEKFNGGNEGTLTLVQGTQNLHCVINTNDFGQETLFEKDIDVVLSYVYKDQISTKVTVKNSF